MVLRIIEAFFSLKRKESIFNLNVRKQLFFSLTVNIIVLSHGIALGWTAPTLRRLASRETPLNFRISLNEASWIAALAGLGSLLGNLLLSNFIDKLGRKSCLYLMALPNICLWILTYAAKNANYLLIGRLIGGLTGGSSIAIIPLCITEIASPRHRGAFQSIFIVAINLGILIGYILSSKLDYHLVPQIVVVLPIIYLFLLNYFPETPHFLIRQDKDGIAIESLRFYKNYSSITPKLQEDFTNLKIMIQLIDDEVGAKCVLKHFITKPALKVYTTGLILLVLNQFSGIYALITYMSDVFALSGAPFEPDTCTILMGVVQLLGNIATIFLIDHYGRKTLIVISSLGIIVGLVAFGCFTYSKQFFNSDASTWIPLLLMTFTILIGNLGSISVIVTSLIEILPSTIRSKVFSCFLALLSFFVFLALKTFPIFMETFGISTTMWSCAGITATTLTYLIFFLPETKGKSLDLDSHL